MLAIRALLLCELHNSLYSLKHGNCSVPSWYRPHALTLKALYLLKTLKAQHSIHLHGCVGHVHICVRCRTVAGDVASCSQNSEPSSCHGSVPSCADAAAAQAAAKVSLQGKLAGLCIAAELVSACLMELNTSCRYLLSSCSMLLAHRSLHVAFICIRE